MKNYRISTSCKWTFFKDKNEYELPHYHGLDGDILTYLTEYDRKIGKRLMK
jgi:hypothetical protein